MPRAASARFGLKTWIVDQPWYFQYWRLDPTVQGVLAMLDEMHRHALFQLRPGTLYGQLTSSQRPAITFQLLNLGDFPLSDDLYIKMNARGKPLTAFETFKARYETTLRDHFPVSTKRTIGTASFPMHEFISRRLDTAWTDFFWTYHKDAGPLITQRVDESFMNLFRMVALVTRDPARDKGNYWVDIETLRSEENPPTYSAFDARRWLDRDFSTLLVSLMESWCVADSSLSSGGLFDEPALLRQLFLDPVDLTVPQVVLFCGYALFIREHEGRYQPPELGEWMRIVHNLGYNSEIDRNERVQNAVKGLSDLLPHSRDILAHIAKLDRQTEITGFAREQQREESLKAGLLLADLAGWRPLIEQAECHGYFRGQIGFLLKFAGVTAEWEKTGNCAWPAAMHAQLQDSFAGYLAKASEMFSAHGLADLGEERWQRALLSLGDYLLPNGGANHSFLVNDTSKPFSWKRLLRDEGPKRNLLKQLWDNPAYVAPLTTGLDSIIQSAAGLEPWREALVQNVEAIRYCEQRNIQHAGDNHVILLTSKKRSAPHAELFTFLLHPRLQPPAPFTKDEYFERDEPHIPLRFPWRGEQRSFDIYGSDGNFELRVDVQNQPDLQARLKQRGIFADQDQLATWVVRLVSAADLDRTLGEIASLLIAP